MSYYRYSNSSYYRPSFFGGFRFFPPVIKALMIINVALYFLPRFFGAPLGDLFANLPLYPLGPDFKLWQLISYMFMHGGIMHLFFNMIALWMFGMELENNWGSRKFLLYYGICGIGAGLTHLYIAPLFGPALPTVGASGAIYGILLAFGMLYPDRPIFIYFLLPMRAKNFVIIYMLLEVFAGVAGTKDRIAHFAHLGGAAVGFIYLFLEKRSFSFRNLFAGKKISYIRGGKDLGYPPYERMNISDANYYDLHNDQNAKYQEDVDRILDKINQEGYQSLSEEEKKILFEASKKLN